MKRRGTLSPDWLIVFRQTAQTFDFIQVICRGYYYVPTFLYSTTKKFGGVTIKPMRNKTNNTDLYNESIPRGEYLVIDEQGERVGVLNREQALKVAYERETDIVVVSPGSKPMVARLMDYSKHRYEQQKKQREMKKNQQVVQLKEIRISPTIDKNDLNTKLKHAIKFLAKGDKVKVSMRFRGRMITHQDIGREVFDQFIEGLKEVSQVEMAPKLEGNQMIAVFAPAKQ